MIPTHTCIDIDIDIVDGGWARPFTVLSRYVESLPIVWRESVAFRSARPPVSKFDLVRATVKPGQGTQRGRRERGGERAPLSTLRLVLVPVLVPPESVAVSGWECHTPTGSGSRPRPEGCSSSSSRIWHPTIVPTRWAGTAESLGGKGARQGDSRPTKVGGPGFSWRPASRGRRTETRQGQRALWGYCCSPLRGRGASPHRVSGPQGLKTSCNHCPSGDQSRGHQRDAPTV